MKDLTFETLFVPAVDRSRAEIEVTAENQGLPGGVTIAQVPLQSLKPGQFTREIGVAEVFAIGTIDSNEGQVSDLSLYEPSPQGLLSRKSFLHRPGCLAAQNGDAVPGLLSFHHS